MREINEEYTEKAYRLIKTIPELEYIYNSSVSFIVLSCDDEKKKNFKTVYADCTKVSDTYKWVCPYDFFITVYEPNIAFMNERQIEILLEHELRHIGINNEGVEPSYYTVPHDIEDFNSIIEKYGLNWSMEGQQNA